MSIEDDAKALAKDALVRVGALIAKNVGSMTDPAPATPVTSSLDEAIAAVAAVNKSLDKKIAAKEEARKIARDFLLKALEIGLNAAATAL